MAREWQRCRGIRLRSVSEISWSVLLLLSCRCLILLSTDQQQRRIVIDRHIRAKVDDGGQRWGREASEQAKLIDHCGNSQYQQVTLGGYLSAGWLTCWGILSQRGTAFTIRSPTKLYWPSRGGRSTGVADNQHSADLIKKFDQLSSCLLPKE